MNHQEKQGYHAHSIEYNKQHQLKNLFQLALAELVLKQPEDPLSFLISHFQQKKKFMMYSVIGYPSKMREKIIDELASTYNLKVLKIDPMFLGLNTVLNDQNDYLPILKSIPTFEVNFEGVIFDNFPSTESQFRALKQARVKPDRVIRLKRTVSEPE
jgi:hypothetical protein